MTIRLTHLISYVSLSILIGVPGLFAQAGKTSSSGPITTNAKATTNLISDASFAKMADQGGLAEVKLGQLAEVRGASQTVKDFGKRMVTDHSKVDDELKTAASKDELTLPAQLSAKDEATYDQLSKLSGAAFDRTYASNMVKDHEVDIAMFQREAKYGKDASIKTFASYTLPTLQDHLKQARQMLQNTSTEASNTAKKQAS